MVLEAATSLWSDDHEQHVINLLKRGKTGQSLPRNDYHIIETYDLVSGHGGENKTFKKIFKIFTLIFISSINYLVYCYKA